ncbi:uncharacterized protein N0V89_000239 [Didymosphaeria variabile]|uniref:Uncharacterized protein n=1 Tax=Didymosphaeria variabile TaxID=1932322 RepID=A0A9W8XUA5_9PLEO|nr:uncharacterized protein N0V89_000239 [Didymosphaeria variabile]KAJ4359683.1 hypothetical protein N0V89_000239 [Didymosphaeria variabile]
MSSSSPTSPNRRKSDPVGGAGSPERRRSSRNSSSSKNKDKEPAPKAKQPQLTNGVSSDEGETVSALSAQDGSAPSDPSPDKEEEKKSKPEKAASKVKKTKKDDDVDAEDNDDEDEEDRDDGQNNQTLASRFNPWKPVPRGEPFREPPFDDAWLRILSTGTDNRGNEFPLPDLSDQPPARTSNGQIVPSLWEDRGITFQKGRYIKDADDNRIDQDEYLVLKLIDMRPKSKEDPTPRRQPTYWGNKNGIPKDWDDTYMIKQLNGSHRDNIRTICNEPTWSQGEADFIASRFTDDEDISIKELAYQFNNRFMQDQIPYKETFPWDEVHKGRTTESIRGEYLLHKQQYDRGEAPKKSEIRDKKWVLANGKTFEEMMLDYMETYNYAGANAVKVKSKNGSDGEGQVKEKMVLPETDDAYDGNTIKQLKQLAEDTKPKGFLKGLTKKGEMVAKFKNDHPGNDNETAVENGNAAEGEEKDDKDDDEGPTEAELTANDGVEVPKYRGGSKIGQPYYGSMKSASIQQLLTNRGLQLPAGFGRGAHLVTPNKQDYIKVLEDDDEAVGRYKQKKPSTNKKKKKSSKSASKTSSSKKRKSSSSSTSVAKKQKTKPSADAEAGGEEDEEANISTSSKKRTSVSSLELANIRMERWRIAEEAIIQPSSPKRNSATSSSSKRHSDITSSSPISPRKASLRNQSSNVPGDVEKAFPEGLGQKREQVEVDDDFEVDGETETEAEAEAETEDEQTDASFEE